MRGAREESETGEREGRRKGEREGARDEGRENIKEGLLDKKLTEFIKTHIELTLYLLLLRAVTVSVAQYATLLKVLPPSTATYFPPSCS